MGLRTLVVLALASSVACKDKEPPKQNPLPAPSASPSASVAPSASAPAEPTNPYTADRIESVLNPTKLPTYTGPTGSIEGTISVRGPASPRVTRDYKRCPDGESIYAPAFREGPPIGPHRALGDAIVAITGYEKFVPPKDDHVKIAFDGCGYTTRTALLTFGQRLEVLNKSTRQMIAPDIEGTPMVALMLVAPHSTSSAKLYPPRPGRFRLIDRGVLGYISVDVYVMMQPLHAVSSTDGRFRIDGVPLGKVTVNAAHPAFSGDAESTVDVQPNVVHKVDLVLTYAGEGDAGAPSADSGPLKPAPRPGSKIH